MRCVYVAVHASCGGTTLVRVLRRLELRVDLCSSAELRILRDFECGVRRRDARADMSSLSELRCGRGHGCGHNRPIY